MKQVLFMPILEAVVATEGMIDELEEIKKEFEEYFMPKLSESCAQTKKILYKIVEEKINRTWD